MEQVKKAKQILLTEVEDAIDNEPDSLTDIIYRSDKRIREFFDNREREQEDDSQLASNDEPICLL